MKKTILIYGVALAAMVGLMKWLEYKYLFQELSAEFYIGIIAVFFTILGIWSGMRLTRRRSATTSPPFETDAEAQERLGISKREREVLELMALGLTNQEIADKLFVSLNTVKTHTSNLFLKLDVNRRTQAIQKGKELRLIA